MASAKTKITAARPDLYIGLVCAAGTDLSEIKNQLRAQLQVVEYNYEEVKVSDLISELLELPEKHDEFDRIKSLMDGGDLIRSNSAKGDGVGAAIIGEIRAIRENSELPSSTAYVIDSLKNPAEISLLDQVYGRNYYTISIYKPMKDRRKNLVQKISEDRREPPNEEHEKLADELIGDDEFRKGKKSQNVRDSFPKADFFIDGTEDVTKQIQRFVGLIFQQPFTTPTADEFNMFVAKAAALRSADLSRIVGAAIVGQNGEILATGCNEVPYPGGGIFFEGRTDGIGDNRDHTKGHDPNYQEIQNTVIEFVETLMEIGKVQSNMTAAAFADELLHGDHKETMKNLRVRNLIEFGRVVHAEMHAITQAAATGRAIAGSTLYCTTFPCHGCARHIISAGVAEVVFIEPYPKSLTAQLYDDEIVFCDHSIDDAKKAGHGKRVAFRPFHGVAPVLYQRVFAMRDRKNERGTIATWNPKSAIPTGAVFGVERPKVEIAASDSLADVLEKITVGLPNQNGEIGGDAANS